MYKIIMVVLIVIASLISTAYADTKKWDKTEKTMAATYIVLHVADITQTLDGVSNYDLIEANPVANWALEQGGNAGLCLFGVATACGVLYMTDLIDNHKWRKWFLGGAMGLKVGVIINNHSLGCRVGGAF